MNKAIGRDVTDKLSATVASATADATGKDERSVRRAAARGQALGDVTGTSLDKGVELDALAKANLVKRSGRLFNGHGVSFRFIGGDLEKNTNFEGPLVDALRCFRAENDLPALFPVALAAVENPHVGATNLGGCRARCILDRRPFRAILLRCGSIVHSSRICEPRLLPRLSRHSSFEAFKSSTGDCRSRSARCGLPQPDTRPAAVLGEELDAPV